MHPLVLAPKVPGLFYFVFGKPIETRGTDSKTFHYIPSICTFSQSPLLTWLLTLLDTDKCTCVCAFLKPEVGWTKFSFGLLACIGRKDYETKRRRSASICKSNLRWRAVSAIWRRKGKRTLTGVYCPGFSTKHFMVPMQKYPHLNREMFDFESTNCLYYSYLFSCQQSCLLLLSSKELWWLILS